MLNKATRVSVFVALVTLVCAGLCAGQSQPTPAAPTGSVAGRRGGAPADAGRGGFTFGNFDPNQIQKMMDDGNRQTLGATAEEWQVLGPRFNKVQTLSRSISGGAMGMLGAFGMGRGGMGMGGGRGAMGGNLGRGLSAIMGEPTPLDKARDDLNAALGNSAGTAELQTVIKAYREAKDKARRELATAQAELRKLCTVQQEATLIAMGLLE